MLYLSEVHLVENDLIGVADSPEPSDESQGRDQDEADLVIGLATDGSILLGRGFGELVELWLGRKGRRLGGLLRSIVALAKAALGRRATSHGSVGL